MEAIKMDNDNIQDVLETRQEVSEHGEKGKLFPIIGARTTFKLIPNSLYESSLSFKVKLHKP